MVLYVHVTTGCSLARSVSYNALLSDDHLDSSLDSEFGGLKHWRNTRQTTDPPVNVRELAASYRAPILL